MHNCTIDEIFKAVEMSFVDIFYHSRGTKINIGGFVNSTEDNSLWIDDNKIEIDTENITEIYQNDEEYVIKLGDNEFYLNLI